MLESGCQGAFSYSFEIHSECSSFCLSSIYIICFLHSGWLAFLSLFLFFLLFLLISHSSLKPVIAVGSRWIVSVLCHCVLLSSYLTGTGLWEVWERIEELLPCPKQHLISCERPFLIIHFLGCLSSMFWLMSHHTKHFQCVRWDCMYSQSCRSVIIHTLSNYYNFKLVNFNWHIKLKK